MTGAGAAAVAADLGADMVFTKPFEAQTVRRFFVGAAEPSSCAHAVPSASLHASHEGA